MIKTPFPLPTKEFFPQGDLSPPQLWGYNPPDQFFTQRQVLHADVLKVQSAFQSGHGDFNPT